MADQSVRPAIADAIGEIREYLTVEPKATDNDLAYMFVANMNRNGHVVVPIGALDHPAVTLVEDGARAFVAGKIGTALGIAKAEGGPPMRSIATELEEALAVCAPKPE